MSEANLHFLAEIFTELRRKTREFVNARIKELDGDDPLKCPISLFRTMDYGRLETAHTRTLAWLLDPTREHGFGDRLIAALMAEVSGQVNAEGLRVDRVESEVVISSGRLDVFAKGDWGDGSRRKWALVIEAKVGAPDSDGQLEKYDDWLAIHVADYEILRIFLTPNGREPKHGREPENGEEKWRPLSYLELMLCFRTVYDELRGEDGFHFLKFYMAGVFQDVCRMPCVKTSEAANPYPVAEYLKTALDSTLKGGRRDPLGKSLVFNLKYMAEMNHIDACDENATTDMESLADDRHIREMASAIGAAAKTNAVDFLELCGGGIKSHFVGMEIATLGKIRKPSQIAKSWCWEAQVHLPSVPNGSFVCGVSIASVLDIRIPMTDDACGVVIPWLYVRGRRNGEDRVIGILGDWIHSRSGEGLTIDKGTLALACIPIIPQPRDGFDVDRDPLIAEVIATFSRISAGQTIAIANSVAGLKLKDDV